MFPHALRIILFIAISAAADVGAFAQTKPTLAPKVEPGLEDAVKWKWWVVPSDEKDWGFPLPEPEPPKPAATTTTTTTTAPTVTAPEVQQPNTYEVKRGDAMIIIAKKFGMKVEQLKTFNEMSDDKIRVGQLLKIPTPDDLKTLPVATPVPKKTTAKIKPTEEKKEDTDGLTREVRENVLLQSFLDREQFSPGPIDGKSGAFFLKVMNLYLASHSDVKDSDALVQKALAVIGYPFVRYALKPEDFRFIAPPAAVKPTAKKTTTAAAPQVLTYAELSAAKFLTYRTPWEFVAERFHCDEAFLRAINPTLKGYPSAGVEFQAPAVIPFEIEKIFGAPLQPPADPQLPVGATIVDMSRLEITRGSTLVAVMPVSSARPDLRGRAAWTVLDVIARPRLATLQELKDTPKAISTAPIVAGVVSPIKAPPPRPVLSSEQYLAAGPNNPVGILWINLAKAKSTDPLPYGLHGTSIPSQVATQQSIGGLRLANWNIIRAARLMPAGTALQWKLK